MCGSRTEGFSAVLSATFLNPGTDSCPKWGFLDLRYYVGSNPVGRAYTFQPHGGKFSSQNFETVGVADNGTTVLFLGFSAGVLEFRGFISSFTYRGFRIFARV